MTVRAKFRVEEKEQHESGCTIRLRPVVDGSDENKRFFNFTPWGEIEIGTVNDDAAQQFVENAEYYVDFTLAD